MTRALLIRVVCPHCGASADILPRSAAWHGMCDGVRMVPVDKIAAHRARKAAEKRDRAVIQAARSEKVSIATQIV